MSVLENQEDAVVIVEPAVKAEDVGVAEAGLDLHLPPQLVLNLVLLDLLLEYYLQCHYVLALPNKKKTQISPEIKLIDGFGFEVFGFRLRRNSDTLASRAT